MKKIFFFLLLFLFPICVYADSARSTIVMDADSGRILYQKNPNERKLIASTTKIMTCIIVLENSNIDDEITVGNEVLSMYGTNIYIEPGEKMKIKDLLYGLMLRSGNDAAITLAYNTLGENKFIEAMNNKAHELGMKNTIFNNPHGLDDDTKNYSTAYDMAILSKYAYKNKMFMNIISTKKYVMKSSIKSYVWYNRVSLLKKYSNCIGGKNGYTPKAGKSLVSYAKKGNLTLVIVTLDDPTIYENHISLYNKYFKLYKNYTVVDKKTFKVDKFYVKKSFIYPMTKNEINNVFTLLKIDSTTSTGKIIIRLNDDIIGTIDLYKKKKIKKEKKSLFEKIFKINCLKF